MEPRFFKTSKENPLIDFLKKFPENEMWRFFVERKRYDFRQELYIEAYKLLNPKVDQKDFPTIDQIASDLEEQDLKVSDLVSIAGDDQDILKFLSDLNLKSTCQSSLTSVINKHQAWRGFEGIENLYLSGTIDGFILILDKLAKEDYNLDLKFLKELHKCCTGKVENMLSDNQPGEFRSQDAWWNYAEDCNSIEGLTEILDYLKKLTTDYGDCFALIILNNETQEAETVRNFDDIEKTREYAEDLHNKVNDGTCRVTFCAAEIQADVPKFLNHIMETLLSKFNKEIEEAETNEDKLTAIFSFLKYSVLHHPFQDGVGRTFSMLLLQFLLLRDKLLPMLITDSNIIPGFSVGEMVEQYKINKKEMKKIFQSPEFISSNDFANPNIKTEELVEKLEPKEKEYFSDCIKKFSEKKKQILGNEKVISTSPTMGIQE